MASQYERWQPHARYRQALDPTAEDVRKLCLSSRRYAGEDRVLFHYNGHGVPRPTTNGEVWVYNKGYTQYIPLSLYDVQTWMSPFAPAVYIFDCHNAGLAVDAFLHFLKQRKEKHKRLEAQKAARKLKRDAAAAAAAAASSSSTATNTTATGGGGGGDDATITADDVEGEEGGGAGGADDAVPPPPPNLDASRASASASPLMSTPLDSYDCRHILLGACASHETLPVNPELPADMFTACLTTPIKTSLRMFAAKKVGLTKVSTLR